MGKSVLVYGKSGSGKTRSLKNFDVDEILLINVIGKDMPFKKKFRYEYRTDDYSKIKNALLKMPTKTAVIDDAGYLQTNMFMRGHSSPKKGSSSFDLFNDIADGFWSLLRFIAENLPDDVLVYIIMHEQTSDYGETKLRTVGKLLDEKVCIEGQVTVSIRCLSDGNRHYFRTQTDGTDISKSPEEMLPLEMDNDLKAVDTAIREYYEFNKGE